MKLNKIFLVAAMTCLPLQHAFSAPIDSIHVTVCDVNGSTSKLLLDKMSLSMQIVAEQLFLNKNTETIIPLTSEYKHLLTEIGDRVFSGYELTDVSIDIAKDTKIILYAKPWGKVITQPRIDLQFSGIEPQTAFLLKTKLSKLENDLRNTISGASIDAGDWTNGVLRKLVREEIKKQLPEFKAAVDVVNEDGDIVIQVIVYPVGQLIRNIKYELHSEEIPNILLFDLKYKYAQECDKLRGLPVEYLKRHKCDLEKLFKEKLLAEKEVKNYNLQPVVNIALNTDLEIDIALRSNEYKIWFEGYGDIGRSKDSLSGKAHLGKYISPRDEIFTEAGVVLDDVKWCFGTGYTRYMGKSSITYQRIMPKGDNVYKFEYKLSPRWRIRTEYFTEDKRSEFGVRYRIHEFLSAEYVYGDDEFYVRIIGNL